jgi:hypothetical protein
MTFFLWTNSNETINCSGCDATIGYSSHGYSHGDKVLCNSCNQDFWREWRKKIYETHHEMIDIFAETREKRTGIKAN